MHDRHIVAHTVFKALILFGFFVLITLIDEIFPLVRPNTFIAFIVVLAFIVSDSLLFSVFVSLGIIWQKYVPFFQIEYILLAFIALILFVLMRFIVFRRTFGVCALLIVGMCLLWWVLMGFFGNVFSLVFILEVLYTIAVGAIFFLVMLWTKNVLA